MEIRVTDPARLGELLSYLRERGCIAYVVGDQADTIEALVPHLFGRPESAAIGELVTAWQAENPDAVLERLPA
jgi:hypothetical protein